MGNRPSAVHRRREAKRGAPSCTPSLSEPRAFAVATRFREQLHGHVRLARDGDSTAVVERYAWVEFDDEMDAATARAATIAWFWLASCVGYSGVENPRFWKRVFCAIMRPRKGCDDDKRERRSMSDAPPPQDHSIRDAWAFFDRPACPFPRVKLRSRDPAVRHAFCGMRPPHGDCRTDKILAEVRHKLRPFMVASRLRATVDVAVSQPTSPPSAIPRFVVRSVETDVLGFPSVDDQRVVFHHAAVVVPVVGSEDRCNFTVGCSPGEIATRLRSLFRIAPGSGLLGRVHVFQMHRDSVAGALVAAVSSILPHATTFHTLRVVAPWRREVPWGGRPVRPFEPIEWAWLGFALFHPDAVTSTWRSLALTTGDLTDEGVDILGRMATGNNLLSVESAGSGVRSSSFYHSARLCEGASIYSDASNDTKIYLQLHRHTWVGLCVASTASLDAWERAVVPGLGLAWVRAGDIVETVSRPAGKCHLRKLQLDLSKDRGNSPAALQRLLALLGPSLDALDLGRANRLDAVGLRGLLAACPQLKSLTVEHDGSLWSCPKSSPQGLPLLKHLQLRIDTKAFQLPAVQALQSSLRNLEALRVHADVEYVGAHTQSIINLLTAPSRLELFRWSDPYCSLLNGKRPGGMLPFLEGRACTQKFLRELPDEAWFHSQGHVTVPTRVAFASVIHAGRAVDSAVGLIDHDLAMLIFSFATSRVPRILSIGA